MRNKKVLMIPVYVLEPDICPWSLYSCIVHHIASLTLGCVRVCVRACWSFLMAFWKMIRGWDVLPLMVNVLGHVFQGSTGRWLQNDFLTLIAQCLGFCKKKPFFHVLEPQIIFHVVFFSMLYTHSKWPKKPPSRLVLQSDRTSYWNILDLLNFKKITLEAINPTQLRFGLQQRR